MTPPTKVRMFAIAAVGALIAGATVVAAQPSLLPETAMALDKLPDRAPAFGARDRASTDAARDRPSDHAPDRAYTLSVLVTKGTDHGPAPAEDAIVVIYELHRRGHGGIAAKAVERGQTNEDGVVQFDLAPGAYGIRAKLGDAAGHTKVRLNDDKRVHVHLSARDGGQPGPHAVGIWTGYRTDEGPQPAIGANVSIERYNATRDSPRNGTWEPVASGTTDDNGQYTTVLPKGIYRVFVDDGELDNHKRFVVRHDKWVRVGLFEDDASTDATGNAETD